MLKIFCGEYKRIVLLSFFLTFLSIPIYAQQSFTLHFNQEVEGVVSRNLLQLFTYYDDFPNERATALLLNRSDREGWCAGIGNSYGFYAFDVDELSISEENNILISPDRSYVNESVGGLMFGFYHLGDSNLALSMECEYDLIKDLLSDDTAFGRMSGKTSLDLIISNVYQLGIDLWDIVDEYSVSASFQLLELPEGLSDYELTALDGAVVLVDSSLASLMVDIGLSQSEYQYSSVDFITPFTFMPFLFFDFFPNENHSYLTMSFSSLPFLGLDIFLTPRFAMHQGGGLQSLELKFELLSLREYLTLGDQASKTNPSYRHRNEEGVYDNLSTMGLFYRRQFINRYTGEESSKDYLGLQMSMFYAKDTRMDYLGMDLILEYDVEQNYTQYEVNLKYYF